MSRKEESPEEKLAPIICGVCGRSFETLSEFKEHLDPERPATIAG